MASHRCARSESLGRCSHGAQLTWQRLVHDDGLDEWGCAPGSPKLVHADCLAGTTSYTKEDTAGFLDELEREGMLFRYEVGGRVYIASRNLEQYDWRKVRPVPALPMTQEVADTRDFTKVLGDGRERYKGTRDERIRATVAWAARYGLRTNLPEDMTVQYTCNARALHVQAPDPPPTRVPASTGKSSVVLEKSREGEEGAHVPPDEPADGDAPSPAATNSGSSDELPAGAREPLQRCGCYDWKTTADTVDAQVPAVCGTTPLGYLLATALVICERQRCPDRQAAFDARVRQHEAPGADFIKRANKILDPERHKPPRGPTCDKCKREERLTTSTLPDRPGRFCTDCYHTMLDEADGEPAGNVIQFADLAGVRATRLEAASG